MRKFLLAEYCEGPFYTGWHLYERDHNDGSPNDNGYDPWGWLPRKFDGEKRAWALCVAMGELPPLPRQFGDDFAEWFATTFPNGLLVDVPKRGPYQLVEVVSKRPKQVNRWVIRDVARAKRSFAKACRRAAKEATP